MMTGEAELIKIPSEARLRVRQLHLHFPGEYRYRSLWPWENIDLRPSWSPTRLMKCSTTAQKELVKHLRFTRYRAKAWWTTFTTFHNDLFCNHHECKAQVQNQAIWYFLTHAAARVDSHAYNQCLDWYDHHSDDSRPNCSNSLDRLSLLRDNHYRSSCNPQSPIPEDNRHCPYRGL